MNNPYQIFKCAVLDISSYVNLGVSADDIKSCINKFFKGNVRAAYRVLDDFFLYEIRTIYEKDEEIIQLMDNIIKELDILLVSSKDVHIVLN